MRHFWIGSSNDPQERKPARLALILAAAFTVAGVLVLSRSDAAAQSKAESGQSASSTQKAPAPAGNAEHGKALYTRVGCYECHDREGQGGGAAGPRLAPNPTAFNLFLDQLRAPRDEMPPYTAKVLSDADVADIYAFLQLIPQPHKVDSIPPLK